jgi:NitT/TauT family transport system substrate-binding protein
MPKERDAVAVTRRSLIITTLGAGLALAGCQAAPTASTTASSSAAAQKQKVTLGLTYIPNVQFAPFYVGDAQGLFAAAGVAATLRHHGGSEGLFTALAAGQEDMVVAGADEMMQARAEGMDLVAIAQYYRQYPVVLVVPDASTIKTASDLKGRSIGVPGKYGESWFGLQVLLKGAGLAASDVTIQEIGYTAQAALASKKVDAVVGFSNNDVVAFKTANVAVRTIPLTSGTLPLVSICLITTRKYLTANPALAKATADAVVKSIAATVHDPEKALENSAVYVPTLKTDAAAKTAAQATLAATIKLWTDASGNVSGKMDATQFASMATFMKDQGLIATVVDSTQSMSNDYVSA